MRLHKSTRFVAAVAVLLDGVALLLVAGGVRYGALAGLGLHLVATFVVQRALRANVGRRAHGRLVLTATLALPVLGPLLAWWLPAPGASVKRSGSEQLFEEYDALVHFTVNRPPGSEFVGDFERDFAHFANVESYAVVLERGTVAEKRDVLKRLVASQKPRHLRLVRSCLTDPDPEVRLLAYGELQNLEQALYRELDGARQHAYDAAEDPDAQKAPAVAHRRLATAGVLDPTVAAWHAREATRLELSLAPAPDAVADATMPRVDSVVADKMPSVRDSMALAEDAFRARDFAHVRRHADELLHELRRLPDWVAALVLEEEAA